MYCSKCGKQMEDGAAFCSGCGFPLQAQNNITEPAYEPQKKGTAIAVFVLGIVLSVICLVLTVINKTIGAYQGDQSEAWFQKNLSNNVESTAEDTGVYKFALKDKDGNVLMTGGIKGASVDAVKDLTGIKTYVVEIVFTESAAEEFAKITADHIGESIGVYLNDEMISSPIVTVAITGGTCQITNMNSYEEAKKLAALLNMTKQ